MNIVVANKNYVAPTETFIRAHAMRLPGAVGLLHDFPPQMNDETPYRPSLPVYILRGVARRTGLFSEEGYLTRYYVDALQRSGADLVLAEYGPTAVLMRQACEMLGIPLAVHFHGYDAHRHDVLEQYETKYKRVFEQVRAVIAVSRPMRKQLAELGADPKRLFLNPYGVDVSDFKPNGVARDSGVHFLSVGRFVEKKAPHLTLLAFHEVHKAHPTSTLTMIGEGRLRDACEDMAVALGVEDCVDFAGFKTHEVIAAAMQKASVFVQHSVQAADGDSEGAPVAIMEAGASGLPVVSTCHAGIPDIVKHGETGYLVEERDVSGMAHCMSELASNPGQVKAMGNQARMRTEKYFSMDASILRLAAILEWAAGHCDEKPDLVPKWI